MSPLANEVSAEFYFYKGGGNPYVVVRSFVCTKLTSKYVSSAGRGSDSPYFAVIAVPGHVWWGRDMGIVRFNAPVKIS